MSLHCCIIDNEEHALESIGKYITRTPGLVLACAETNPLIALNKITNGEVMAPITFLDIDMPQISGIELAELIRPYTQIIFTTAFSQYAVKAFEKEALDYLLKPISYERFLKAVNKAKEKIKKTALPEQRDYIFIQSEGKGKLIRIKLNDIIFIESAQNYVRIHLEQAAYLAYLTMKEIEDRLPARRFMRVHRAYVVNLDRISGLGGNMLHMANESAVPIGQSYRQNVLDIINAAVIRSKRLQ